MVADVIVAVHKCFQRTLQKTHIYGYWKGPEKSYLASQIDCAEVIWIYPSKAIFARAKAGTDEG